MKKRANFKYYHFYNSFIFCIFKVLINFLKSFNTMKKLVLLPAFILFSLSLFAQNATVKKVNGFDIYIYSEPSKEYDEVFEASADWNWGAMTETGASLDNIVETFVRNVKKKNEKAKKKGEPTADAIIIYSNTKGSAIKYKKDDKTETAKN